MPTRGKRLAAKSLKIAGKRNESSAAYRRGRRTPRFRADLKHLRCGIVMGVDMGDSSLASSSHYQNIPMSLITTSVSQLSRQLRFTFFPPQKHTSNPLGWMSRPFLIASISTYFLHNMALLAVRAHFSSVAGLGFPNWLL